MVTDEIIIGTILRRVTKENIDFDVIGDYVIDIDWFKSNKEFKIIEIIS